LRILLVQPEFPITYWGFQYGLPLANKRVSLPPLGLVSFAALLPNDWELRLVDLNAEALTDTDLDWADVVMAGGMHIQAPSMREALARGRQHGCLTVVGGPSPTTAPEDYPDVDILFQGEAEGRIDQLLEAMKAPRGTRLVLEPIGDRPALDEVPVPRFDLLKLDLYASMSVQYSRGCPFQCEFCDIIEIFGRKPRVKRASQMIAELTALRDLGYGGSLFVVDDNFIGHKPAVRLLLPAVAAWQRENGSPFELYTEASVNLAGDPSLLAAMVDAGFSAVFLGIESPSEEALAETQKNQNLRMDLSAAIERITRAGLEVLGGFIVGFDTDTEDIFERQRAFIAGNPIPCAMVGLLNALPGTALWRRMNAEGRLRVAWTGDQLERPNFTPAMNERALLKGYSRLLSEVYSPAGYYGRCRAFLEMAPAALVRRPFRFDELSIAAKTIARAGIRSPDRAEFWKLVLTMLKTNPQAVGWVIAHGIWGEHLIRYTRENVLPRIQAALAELDSVPTYVSPAGVRAVAEPRLVPTTRLRRQALPS